jgi:hypothetical protein
VVDLDKKELDAFVTAYHAAYSQTQSHRESYIRTACWAIFMAKLPIAYWTSAKIIAYSEPTHALLFPFPSGLGYIGLTVGGLSSLYDLNPVFDPKNGLPGWKRLAGEDFGFYLEWAAKESKRWLKITTEDANYV